MSIFCRNLLIYFDRPTQDRAVGVLRRLLTPEGTLFVAPSETGLLLSHGFESAKMPLALRFANRPAVSRGTKPSSGSVLPRALGRSSRSSRPLSGSGSSGEARVAPTGPAERPGRWRRRPRRSCPARRQGLFRRSRILLRTSISAAMVHRRRRFTSSGLVRDVAGNPTDAANYYRKALYLDPDHHETLVHLAFLVEQQGDSAAAQLLRNRARRVEQREKA